MSFIPHGKQLIAGDWVAAADTFASEPAHGPAYRFSTATADFVDRAVEAAEDAFWTFGFSTRTARAAFLEAIAQEIEARAQAITEIGWQETGLPAARLEGERARTTGQLRLFADHIRKGEYLDRRHDVALPDRKPLPRPEIYLMQRPVGPVAVFGASNFPLAFSTAGGDTAAALAAGCSVVFRGHPAHPGTGEIVAEAVKAAADRTGMPKGVFSLLQGTGFGVGTALVQHPRIKAVAFTGSLRGGRSLFDLCAARPEPIPFFGELGSVNPVFVLPGAASERAEETGRGWAASLTQGVGQLCTNPGIVVMVDGDAAERFIDAARTALTAVGAELMLTSGIAAAYRLGGERLGAADGVDAVLENVSEGRNAAPSLYRTSGAFWLSDACLGEEVFGPAGLIVTVKDDVEMVSVAAGLEGQLTCTLHLTGDDLALGRTLVRILERKAGRVLANGFPTGVEVVDSIVHGGPYPASTNFGATSVGTLSIRRFLRPVCYQNLPAGLLPDDLMPEEPPQLENADFVVS
jgi:NADP-dependent aldehyde dehydrogenase